MKNIKVLTIDDEYMIRRTIRAFLEDESFIVIEAEDGEEGIETFRSQSPDVILCDLRMHKVDGLDVLKAVTTESPNTPIIMVSGTGVMKDVIEAMRLGAWNYIEKPIRDLNILSIAINNALEKARLIQENIQYEKNLEKMLETRTNQLIITERMAAFSQVIQGIVHNMRSPLNVTLNIKKLFDMTHESIVHELDRYSHLLPEKVMNDVSSLGDIISINHKASERLNDMVNSLMAKSRTDKSDEVKLIDLNEIIKHELDFLISNIQYKSRIKTYSDFFPEVIMTKVVQAEIAQIFGNLIKNSIDAMYGRTDIQLEIKTGKDDNFCWFCVKDNGPGIPKEIQAKIFDPFFTTKPTEKKENSDEPIGTGLGLHFCRDTARSYGGKVELESEPDKGTKITVFLPLHYKELSLGCEDCYK